MKKDKKERKYKHNIENINYRVNNGDPICIPCLLKIVKKKKQKNSR